jgi:hypothetical protein
MRSMVVVAVQPVGRHVTHLLQAVGLLPISKTLAF